jgi:transposase
MVPSSKHLQVLPSAPPSSGTIPRIEFRLDEWVPTDHQLKGVDAVLDLSGLCHQLAPFCSRTERPSIDPELMMQMLLVGYCYNRRSERRLCERRTSISHTACLVDWVSRTPSRIIRRFQEPLRARVRESALLRRSFEDVAVQCERGGLVSGGGFVIASVIEADASRGRQVREYLATYPQSWTHASRGRVNLFAGFREALVRKLGLADPPRASRP